MIEEDPATPPEEVRSSLDRSVQPSEARASNKERGMSLSMHEGVAVWCDCCSCEAEPYWVEAAEAMENAPSGDRGDANP